MFELSVLFHIANKPCLLLRITYSNDVTHVCQHVKLNTKSNTYKLDYLRTPRSVSIQAINNK